jgi:hypothetical protein
MCVSCLAPSISTKKEHLWHLLTRRCELSISLFIMSRQHVTDAAAAWDVEFMKMKNVQQPCSSRHQATHEFIVNRSISYFLHCEIWKRQMPCAVHQWMCLVPWIFGKKLTFDATVQVYTTGSSPKSICTTGRLKTIVGEGILGCWWMPTNCGRHMIDLLKHRSSIKSLRGTRLIYISSAR